MASRYLSAILVAACSLLLAGPAIATGNRPAASGGHPVPVRRAPAARPAAAPVPAAPATAYVPQPEAAPHSLYLTGIILNADGQPRPGACVFPSATPRLIAVTDATGKFTLQVPATAGTIPLQADYFGLGSSRITVDGQHPEPIRVVLGQ